MKELSVVEEFAEVYSQISGSRPTYMSLEEIKTGILRWRLQVFEKNTATIGGDMLLLCIEKPTKEECLREGIRKLKNIFG